MRFHHLLAAAGLTGIAALAPAAPALATFPGHDGRIVFGAPTDQGVQLSTVRPNGRGLHQITNVAGDAIHPDWSPDGRTIVFELDTEEGANVAFMCADGGPIRVVPAPAGTFEGQPSFMPDGRHILFTQFNGEEEATLDHAARRPRPAPDHRRPGRCHRSERRARRPRVQLRRRPRPQLGGRAGAVHQPAGRHAPAPG